MLGLSRARAIGAFGALLAAGPLAIDTARSATREDPADLKLLDSLLATANQGVALYNGAISANVLTAPVGAVVGQFAGDHAAHRDALVAAITNGGGTPQASTSTPQSATTPAALPPTPPHSDADLLTAALAFEREATGIYLASIGDFKNRAFAKTAGSILGVDAAHVALLSEALRQNPAFPSSFVTA